LADEAILAEYTSLRQEIADRYQRAANIFTFQLTSAGAVFAFVLSDVDAYPLLLILPVTSYILHSRYTIYILGSQRISRYIQEVLSPAVSGTLKWDAWYRAQPPLITERFFVHPLTLTFPLPSLLSLVCVSILAFARPYGALASTGIGVACILGLLLTASQFRLLRHARVAPFIVMQWRRSRPGSP